MNFLPEFLAQDYPTFEVIVVNDNSVDDTSDVLKAYSLQYPNLKIVTIPDNDRFYGSKKFALTLGIKMLRAARSNLPHLTMISAILSHFSIFASITIKRSIS